MTTDQAQTADYQKTIRLRACASDVFDALTTVTGLSSWWTRATGSGEAGGEVRFHDVFGARQLVPRTLPAFRDTLYDVASLTKAVATSVLAMRAVAAGGLALDAPVASLLPDNLERLRRPAAEQVIAQGRAATQMPAFGTILSTAQIKQLVDHIYGAPASAPVWDVNEIAGSRVIHHTAHSLPDKPVFDADPLNLFVVVEAGDHHATILDGDRLEPLARRRPCILSTLCVAVD